MSENLSIKTIDKNNKSILVDWSDGFKSKYNFLWLRDNCPSEVHPQLVKELLICLTYLNIFILKIIF